MPDRETVVGTRVPSIVDICKVVRSPGSFDGKEITMSAIYFSNFENSGLYGMRCKGKSNVVWLDTLCNGRLEDCAAVERTLASIPEGMRGGNRERHVVLRGVFRDATTVKKRFGVNLRARFAFELIEVMNAKSSNNSILPTKID
jgi:hypothetical protein